MLARLTQICPQLGDGSIEAEVRIPVSEEEQSFWDKGQTLIMPFYYPNCHFLLTPNKPGRLMAHSHSPISDVIDKCQY